MEEQSRMNMGVDGSNLVETGGNARNNGQMNISLNLQTWSKTYFYLNSRTEKKSHSIVVI